METKNQTNEECRCPNATCGCAGETSNHCSCGEACACVRTCRCGGDCQCPSAG